MNTLRAAVGVPDDHLTIEMDGTRIVYTDKGSGLPVICLHATGHGARDFEGVKTMLPDGFRFLALDWPGQGRSGEDSQPASAQRYAELLDGFIDELGLDRVVLLGNSVGGAAAIIYASANPTRVAGLVLADPGGLAKINPFVRLFCAAMTRFFRAGAKRRRWFLPLFRMYYHVVLSRGPIADHRARIVNAGYEHARVLAEAWNSFGTPEADIRALCPKLQCPVLVSWAKHDRVIPYSVCRKAIRTIPNAKIEMFNAGHAAFLEDPIAFEIVFRSFLANIQPNSPPGQTGRLGLISSKRAPPRPQNKP